MPAQRVLLFTRTTGFRHRSIPAAVTAFRELAAELGLDAVATEDPAEFTAETLADCRTVVFLSTTGEVLTEDSRQALEGHLASGGGFLGVHSAAGTEYDWPFYGGLVGARFRSHPESQPAILTVEDRAHPATAHLPERWPWTDEWYDFRTDPRPGVRVLLSVDEGGYRGGGMGAGHPLAWCHHYGGGRSFYTALGHHSAAYTDPDFRRHLLGALRWTCGDRTSRDEELDYCRT
ncbi:type 1 glutamine amidotransferase [Streptacidiphilus sp. MAP12-16]|uniref:ThuA domain-containing protein n=1 Tax=Streptacidiphilus sp. MAP12-16 TaxID=3156300 RepID=UPI00351845F2